ncbi:MAG: tetratricopeptide repeat protein, partial [Burkholderiales bacterium]
DMPPNPIIEALGARIAIAQHQTEVALARYRGALRQFPHHKALVYGYADTLVKNSQSAKALEFVTDQLRTYPGDYRLHELQARSYASQGRVLLQHQAQAEAYAELGNFPAAIEQLEIALRAGDGDFYQLSIAEARLRQLRSIEAEVKDQPDFP